MKKKGKKEGSRRRGYESKQPLLQKG